MTIPHIGSTGVIQNPGVLGAAAQGLQGLPQILLALQQQKAQQARDALNAQYVHAQIGNLDEDNQRAREQMQLSQKLLGQEGAGIGALASLGAPSREQPASYLGNGMVLPEITERRPGVDQVIGQLAQRMPGALPGIMTKGTEVIASARKREERDRAKSEAMAGLGGFPPEIQAYLRPIIQSTGKMDSGVATETLKLLMKGMHDPELMSRVFTASSGMLLPVGAVAKAFGVDPSLLAKAGVPEGYTPPNRALQTAVYQNVNAPPRPEEVKDAGYFDRALSAEKKIRATGQPTINPTDLYLLTKSPLTWGQLASRGAKTAWGPYIAFLQAALRKDTGSTFNASEIPMLIQNYIPVGGDSPDLIAFKAEQRKLVIGDIGIGANRVLGQRNRNFQSEIESAYDTGTGVNRWRQP